MKKFFKLTIFPVIAALAVALNAALFTGCVFINISGSMSAGSTIQAQGDRETYTINTGAFDKIKIEGVCEVRYHSGNSGTATLEIQPNVREYFTAEVKNGVLVIGIETRVNYPQNKIPILTVYAPSLSMVSVDGAGLLIAQDKITSDTLALIILGAGSIIAELDVNNLTINVSGAGKFDLSGKADNSNITFSGAGDLNADSLLTKDTIINMSGAGTIKVNASQTLYVTADGAGSIGYKGMPRVSLNTSGMVSVKPLN